MWKDVAESSFYSQLFIIKTHKLLRLNIMKNMAQQTSTASPVFYFTELIISKSDVWVNVSAQVKIYLYAFALAHIQI